MTNDRDSQLFSLPLDDEYRFDFDGSLFTPALVIYDAAIDSNISITLQHLRGERKRWRPHVKTAKLRYTIQKLLARGIHQCKCSTTLELATACDAGIPDALLAYPAVGATAQRLRELARSHPRTRIAGLVETAEQVQGFAGSEVGLFIDVNSGMDRTGISLDNHAEVCALARKIDEQKLDFRGLHYYEGHFRGLDRQAEERQAHSGYDRLLSLVHALEKSRRHVEEIITSGTPSFPYATNYAGFEGGNFLHRISPGTILYNDCSSLSQLPSWGYRPAALIVSSVISRPAADRITCDAGHKAISADAGIPTCVVLGHPSLVAGKPSEEHLPLHVQASLSTKTSTESLPKIGERLHLLPRHICPTVNNFDDAVIIRDGQVIGIERVTARGHEKPLQNWQSKAV
jgi:D-serine deaminase-like pyridoxal phosphate-dependent protein